MIIYMSSGMDTISELEYLASELIRIFDFKIIVPKMISYCKYHGYTYGDIEYLKKSDCVICHIPKPSVGACMEVGFFRGIKSFAPIIAYKCMDHPWIDMICTVKYS